MIDPVRMATAHEHLKAAQRILQRENATIAICHHSGFGRVVQESGKRYWQAL